MAVDEQSQPRFFEGRCHFFFCRNSTMTGDRHMVRGKENIGHFVFCRMAPSVMTSGDPDSQNCFWFALLLWVRFAQKVCNRSLPFFLPVVGVPASMTSAKSGCYPSRDVATGTNFGHFKTFSVGSRCYFVMLSLHSFDLLYSSGLVVDSFRIVELLRICYGFVVQDVVEFL